MVSRVGRHFIASVVERAGVFSGSSSTMSIPISLGGVEACCACRNYSRRSARGGGEDRRYEARRTLLKLHADAAEWFHENLLKGDVGESARKYLKHRGITAEIAKQWQLGYAPDEWDAFGSWARGHGYSTRDLITSGIAKTRDDTESAPGERSSAYDRFRGRIIFPICNDVGEVIGFSGRLLKDTEGAAKYLNSPETPLFRKGHVLFGLHKTKRALIEANCAVVCEGQLDLISLFEAGITNVVAPQGPRSRKTGAALETIRKRRCSCFDADAAGQKAAERSLDALLQNDLIVRVPRCQREKILTPWSGTKGKRHSKAALPMRVIFSITGSRVRLPVLISVR
jgi:DNA primase